MLNLNPIRSLLTLGVDAFEAALHFIDFNPAADDLWDWRTHNADRLADAESRVDVWEPSQSSSSAAHSWAGTADDESGAPPSPPPDVEAPRIQLTRDDLLRASIAARSHAINHAYSEKHAATYRDLADRLYDATGKRPQ